MERTPPAQSISHAYTPMYRGYMLAVLTITYVFNGVDRSIMWVMLEPMKRDLGLTDMQLGWLSGFAFGAVYALVGVPIGLLADRAVRKRIIATAVGVWSAMTIACGFATTFWQLFVARVAVGAAESGAPPASISIISDLYPRSSRATAIGVYMSAISIALVVTFAAGGWIAQHYGWRSGFWIAGVPGIILTLIIGVTFREPPRGMSDVVEGMPSPVVRNATLATTVQVLRSRQSSLWMLSAFTLSNLTGVGLATFMTSLLLRSHGLTLGQAGLMVGFGHLAAAVGMPIIGQLVDRLSIRDTRWAVWMPVIACVVSIPIVTALVTIDKVLVLGLLLCVLSICTQGQSSCVYASLQNLVEPGMRATTLSIAYVIQNLVPVGFGAVIVGALSDSLTPRFGGESLGYAMIGCSVLFAAAAVAYLAAARTLRADLAAAIGAQ